MNIHEYQAKEILRKEGVPIPPGEVASTPDEVEAIAKRFGGTVVVKAQVHAGGRGKAGGVKLAKTPAEAKEIAKAILALHIKGLPVQKVLVTPAADIATEAYVGIILDRASKKPVFMGGDFAPQATVAGALLALSELDPAHSIQLVGRPEVVSATLDTLLDQPDYSALRSHRDRIAIVEAPDVIEMTDKPGAAVRSKQKSSMEFEKEFNIDIPDEDAEKLRTVGDAIGYLNSKMGSNA